MLEVLLPFLYMKQADSLSNDNASPVDDARSVGGRSAISGISYQTVSARRNTFDLAHVYAYFKRFVHTFIPNNLHTKFNGSSNILPYLRCCMHL